MEHARVLLWGMDLEDSLLYLRMELDRVVLEERSGGREVVSMICGADVLWPENLMTVIGKIINVDGRGSVDLGFGFV
jgi:hypothetical protein